ncbi:MAG TPA: hypothetical protein PKD37_00795 [Oligoflexia bacterium]|nr:hypothetical protein [Oligoflexia bacterium]HMP26517.1 hypothetical protein [Oligoflexia bacterium]
MTADFFHKNIACSLRKQFGLTVFEALVAVSISATLLGALMQELRTLVRTATDSRIRLTTQLQAQSIIDMVVPEFRMIGNGVPFKQSNFQIDETTLSNPAIAEPILTSVSNATRISFRINETGDTYIVTSDFNPATGDTVSLTNVSKIAPGNHIFITNSTVGDDDGFFGIVESVNSAFNQVTFVSSSKVFSPGGIFSTGSLLEVVPIVTYNSPDNWSGITRDSGNGSILLVPNSKFTVSYLKSDGSIITLPLVGTVDDPLHSSSLLNVRALRFAVSVRSSTPLSSGELYTSTVTQDVAIRNFNYNY